MDAREAGIKSLALSVSPASNLADHFVVGGSLVLSKVFAAGM